MMTPGDWNRQEARLKAEALQGNEAHAVLYESVALVLSELEALSALARDLHGRLAHEENRIQDMVHQMARLESRVHEEVE